MKSIHILSALLLLAGSCSADPGKVILQAGAQSGGGTHDNKTHVETRQHWVEIKVRNLSQIKLDGLKLKWTLFASDLQRGTDRKVVEKSGEQAFSIEPGSEVQLTTPKVDFKWTPMHAERTGSGRRARAKKVDETGHRYHGYRLQVIQDGAVIGEAASDRALLNPTP